MINIKTEQEIKIMEQSGALLSSTLAKIVAQAIPGAHTKDLDKFAEEELRQNGGFPIFKGYGGFPTSICTSLNSEVVHGSAIPDRILKKGDLLSIDIGVRYPAKKGLITDMATSLIVGDEPTAEQQKLMDVTRESLNISISLIKPGIKLGAISHAIQEYVEKNNLNVVRDLVGHGVGHKLHEPPQIPNYGDPQDGVTLEAGMTLAIEPMVTVGSPDVIEDKKTKAYKTIDDKLSAHFEHTVLVTPSGSQILTK
jgi:methionyl aminopeptidase